MKLHAVRALFVWTVCLVGVSTAHTQPTRDHFMHAIRGAEGLLGDPASDTETFAQEHLSAELRDATAAADLKRSLHALRDAARGAEASEIRPEGERGLLLLYETPGGDLLPFHALLDPEPPHLIEALWLEGGPALGEADRSITLLPQFEPFTWETFPERLRKEEARGFSGSVLVVRDGEIVLDEGYGFANRDKKIPNTPTTIYGIGSTPIDFTKAGILLLAEEGELALDDPITRFFDNVPEDKRSITIEQLMEGRSGLRNFHGRATDPDPDLFYIDRDEAVRRIFEGRLLFEPGTDFAHSHSAWGLLAAVIEVVTGQSYPEFTSQRLFEPAGMEDTGFYGVPIPEHRLAIGYSPDQASKINAPPYWGETSWLVMGSGGQVSTTHDMYRWLTALREGNILGEEALERYWAPPGTVLAGGSMYGYEIVYTEGPGTFFVIIWNSNDEGRLSIGHRIAEALAELVATSQRPPFSLGVEMGVRDDGAIEVVRVLPGSAAQDGGLLPGDVLLSANGRSLSPDPLDALMPSLRSGETIRFEIRRNGERLELSVTPARRTP